MKMSQFISSIQLSSFVTLCSINDQYPYTNNPKITIQLLVEAKVHILSILLLVGRLLGEILKRQQNIIRNNAGYQVRLYVVFFICLCDASISFIWEHALYSLSFTSMICLSLKHYPLIKVFYLNAVLLCLCDSKWVTHVKICCTI